MLKLLKKEILLTMHPTSVIFLGLSAMLLIPNYPYYTIFFYMSLAIFFTCLTGRENHDVFYTMMLPVNKEDIVRARFALVIFLEMLQMIVAVPFALLRQSFPLPGNAVGMDANIAFFGFTFAMLGIFHLVFFEVYYKDINKVGKAFVVTATVEWIYIIVAEALTHVVPFMRDKLDTSDSQYVPEKLVVLAIGIIVYVLCTFLALKRAQQHFKKLDI